MDILEGKNTCALPSVPSTWGPYLDRLYPSCLTPSHLCPTVYATQPRILLDPFQ